jgi:uncharacterized ion transporter superfamily protein YfcC
MSSSPVPITSPSPSASRAPNTLLILFALATVTALAVPWMPAGYFEAGAPVALERYRVADASVAVSWFASGDGIGWLNFLFDGFTSGSRSGAAIGVIAFVLLVGGAFGVIQASGVTERGLARLVDRTATRPALLLVAVTVACSSGGAVFGMGEETIAFVALLLPVMRRLGYPPEVSVMITYMASQVGFATSWMNPFSVAVAQGIAGLPLLSGAPLRIGLWLIATAIAVGFVLRYASRQRSAPVAAQGDSAAAQPAPMNWADVAILLGLLATVCWIVWGVTRGGYYIAEIATQFFALGVFAGVVAVIDGRISANAAAEAFADGARQLVPCALVIAMAKGLVGLMGGSDPHAPSVLNTGLFVLADGLRGTPELLAAQGMFAVQSVFNFFVTSGSAQAAITMPLMAGLGDLVGVTRQTAVLAFQLGDGLANMVVPTSAAMMGAIGMAGLNWLDWIRMIWKFFALVMALGAAAIAFAVISGYA